MDVREEVMSGIQAGHQTTPTFLFEDAPKSLAHHYNIKLKTEEVLVEKCLQNIARERGKSKIPDTATKKRTIIGQSYCVQDSWQRHIFHPERCLSQSQLASH